MTDEPAASEIGRKLRQIRHARRKSLAVIAGRAGISISYLSRLESGERALDRRSLIIALANALEVAPTEITSVAVTTPGELPEDRSLKAVRLALLSVSMNEPRGGVLPADVLSARVTEVLTAQNNCRYAVVGEALPGLIRDLHTTLNAGRDERDVSATARADPRAGNPSVAPGHRGAARSWLAGRDTCAARLRAARRTGFTRGERVRNRVRPHGSWRVRPRIHGAPVDAGTGNSEAMQASGMLTLTSSLLAAAKGDHTGGQRRLSTLPTSPSAQARATPCGSGSDRATWACGACLSRWRRANTRRPPGSPRPSTLPRCLHRHGSPRTGGSTAERWHGCHGDTTTR